MTILTKFWVAKLREIFSKSYAQKSVEGHQGQSNGSIVAFRHMPPEKFWSFKPISETYLQLACPSPLLVLEGWFYPPILFYGQPLDQLHQD